MSRLIFLLIIFVLLAAIFIFREPQAPCSGFLLQPPPQTILTNQEAIKLIHTINQHNASIRSFACNIKISIQGRFFVRATADVKYEKPKNLRMLVRSLVGLELEIGSNNDALWFWSRRMDPPALYYSTYANLAKTGLKTPFHPVFLKSVFGLDDISTENAIVCRRGDNWQVTQQTQNVEGEPVVMVTIIDPKTQTIIGHYIYQNNIIVCSAETYEQSKIILRWYEEDITMIWEIYNQQTNISLDNSNWIMPSDKVMVDLSSLRPN